MKVHSTIKKVDGEYQVRFHLNGKYRPEMTYFTNDQDDAKGTQRLELSRLARVYTLEGRY